LMRLASRLERWLYHVSDYITCVSQPMKAYIEHCVDSSKIRVVYKGVSDADFAANGKHVSTHVPNAQSDSGDTVSDKLDKRTLHLVYAGNIGLVQDLHVWVESLKYVCQETREKLAIRIIGSGAQRSYLEAIVAAD